MDTAIYVGHCIHSGNNMNYKFANSLDQTYNQLPNLYAISVMKPNGANKTVQATILIKTDSGDSKDEIEKIYGALVASLADLKNLPLKDVVLHATKINYPAGQIPDEENIENMFRDTYTINSVGGSA